MTNMIVKVYEVLMRNPQTRMHKSWETDGYLVVRDSCNATLKDEDNVTLSTGNVKAYLAYDDEIKIGSRDCKIQDEIPLAAYAQKFKVSLSASRSAPMQRQQASIQTTSSRAPVSRPSAVQQHSSAARSTISSLNPARPSTSKPFKRIRTVTSNVELERSQQQQQHSKVQPLRPLSPVDGNQTSRAQQNQRWASVELMIDGTMVQQIGQLNQTVPNNKKKRTYDDNDEESHDKLDMQRHQTRGETVKIANIPMETQLMPPPNEPVKSAKGKQRAHDPEQADDNMDDLQDVEVFEPAEKSCFKCQWRKKTTKKNPVWEGDGVLLLKDAEGKDTILKDVNDQTKLARSALNVTRFEIGDIVKIGNYECEIAEQIPVDDYLDRSVFKDGYTSVGRKPANLCSRRPPLQRTADLDVRTPLEASASNLPSTSFFKLPQVVARSAVEVNRQKQVTREGNSKAFVQPMEGHSLGTSRHFNPSKPGPRHDPKALGAIVMSRPDKGHEEVHNKRNLPIVDVVLDPKICSTLRPHQIEGVQFMYECVMGFKSESQGCILADEMGLGKTMQAVALIWTLLKQSPYWSGQGMVQKAMIVCPVTLTKQWAAEIRRLLGREGMRVMIADKKEDVKRFCQGKAWDVIIVGYERLRTCIDSIQTAQPPIGLVICDEGHRIKSNNAKVTKALRSIPTKRRVVISGTPIQNDLQEFHTMCDFVFPGCLDSYSTFKKIFERVILKSRDPNCPLTDKQIGQARSEQLSRIAQTFMIRRTSDIIAKFLPPKIEYCVFVAPTQLEVDLYETILSGKAVRDVLDGAAESNAQQLGLLNMLRKVSTTPGLLMQQARNDKGSESLKDNVKQILANAGSDPYDFALSGKLSVLGTLLQHLRTLQEKIVIVSNYTQTLNIIEEFCKRQKYPTCRLDGTTDAKDRHQVVQGFNNGHIKNNFAFLLSSKSGGTGLNIIGASRLVMVDAEWNPSTDMQAMARIHRDGQQRRCVIYRLFTAGTIDEKIFQRQITKLGLSGSVMDGRIGAQAKTKSKNEFTLNDLRDIFRLHKGTGSQTHDLLECRCHLSLNDDPSQERPAQQQQMDGSQSDDDCEDDGHVELKGFQQASQWQGDSNREIRSTRNKLTMLRQWHHYNCTDEQSVDEIEDELLRVVVYDRVACAPDEIGSEPLGNGGMRLRGSCVGFVFGQKKSAQQVGEEEEEEQEQEQEQEA
ncbi:helicase [Microbotryomycetes sp. JL221]|nr:helicase [Microbotryomycetes sp. JL221]